MKHEDMTINAVADAWEAWCGPTRWSNGLKRLAELGGSIKWWCGYPRSASAIPLTFELFRPDGSKFPSGYRLRDIEAAVAELESRRPK